MKSLRYPQPRQAEIIDGPSPAAEGKISIARTLATSISAGTEMGFYRGTAPQLSYASDTHGLFGEKPDNITYPMQSDKPGVWWMGYSAVGRVEGVGPEEKDLAVSDLVWAQQGHKTVMAGTGFKKLPPEANPEHASLLALISIAFNGMLDARVKMLDEVVIFGMGTLGQLLLQMCKLSGAFVTAVDMLDARLELARQMGANLTHNPATDGDVGSRVQQHTTGRGADVVIEVSGSTNALGDALRCAGVDGTVTVMSFHQDAAKSLYLGREFHHKRLTLRSSQVGSINPAFDNGYDVPRRMQQAVRLLSMLKLDPLISHRVKFDELPAALKMIDSDPGACQAVVVSY